MKKLGFQRVSIFRPGLLDRGNLVRAGRGWGQEEGGDSLRRVLFAVS